MLHGPRPLRVLFANATSAANPLLAQLVGGLRDEVEYTACTFDGPGPLDEQLAGSGVAVHHLPSTDPRHLPRATAAARRLLAELEPDLVHVNLFGPGLAVELARLVRAGSPPSVFTRHHDRSHHILGKTLHVRADRFTARRAAHVIAPSAAVRDTLVLDEGVPPGQVTVVHHGIDWDALGAGDEGVATAWRERLPGSHLAVALGRLDPVKAYPDLLDAIADARRQVPGLHLAIAGEGGPGAREALQRHIDVRGLRDAVTLLGRVGDVASLLRAADAFVQASRSESFGLATLEAAGLGVPLAITTPGGTAEITAGITPAIAPGDVTALAGRIVAVLQDPDARAGAARAAGAVRARFTPARMAAGHLGVYRRVLDQRRS